jgi:HicA toxin of bacterial toxin-antitoxin,
VRRTRSLRPRAGWQWPYLGDVEAVAEHRLLGEVAVSVESPTAKLEARVPLKVAELMKILEVDGWYLVATRGSHRQFKHPTKAGA